MATTTAVLVPLEEYLATSYRPDRDWIDGEVRERSLGEWSHAGVQGFLTRFLGNHSAEWDIWVLPEQRLQTSEQLPYPGRVRACAWNSVRRDLTDGPAALHRDPLAGGPDERHSGEG